MSSHDPVAQAPGTAAPAPAATPHAGTAGPGTAAAGTGRRAFEVVLEHIESLILDGTVQVGDRLPAERDLAAQLGVSRPAIREAIRTLEAQGVLASRVGSGQAAGTHVISERSEALGRLLRLQVALAQFPLDDVVVARIALESSSARLAAAHADATGLHALVALLGQMEQAQEPEAFNELDTRFHVAVAQLAGNMLVGDLTQAVRESLRLPILQAERQMSGWHGFRDQLVREHRSIADALRSRDGGRAAALMEQHIRNSYASLPMGPPHGNS